jgi:putative flavoprotein involved in K+ transport
VNSSNLAARTGRWNAESVVQHRKTSVDSSEDNFEVVAIGAGQAGLAVGYFLARRGRHFVILDRADSIASAWRERWESLTLFTPRRYNSLPGLQFPGVPDSYPIRDEVIDYLERYA